MIQTERYSYLESVQNSDSPRTFDFMFIAQGTLEFKLMDTHSDEKRLEHVVCLKAGDFIEPSFFLKKKPKLIANPKDLRDDTLKCDQRYMARSGTFNVNRKTLNPFF